MHPRHVAGEPCSCPSCAAERYRVCPVDDCRVGFWKAVVASGQWQGIARDAHDARMTLASHELVCVVFHRREATPQTYHPAPVMRPVEDR